MPQTLEEFLSDFPSMEEVRTGIQYPLEDANKRYLNPQTDEPMPKVAFIKQHLRLE